MRDYTICAYMRLSNEDRDVFGRKAESRSITSQRRLILDYIDRQPEFKGCSIIERCDDGISGRYFDTRPQFMDMIELTKKGKVNCIIVKDCSRFGRDYVELGDYLEQLPALSSRCLRHPRPLSILMPLRSRWYGAISGNWYLICSSLSVRSKWQTVSCVR